jgi:hypothetical protein
LSIWRKWLFIVLAKVGDNFFNVLAEIGKGFSLKVVLKIGESELANDGESDWTITTSGDVMNVIIYVFETFVNITFYEFVVGILLLHGGE